MRVQNYRTAVGVCPLVNHNCTASYLDSVSTILFFRGAATIRDLKPEVHHPQAVRGDQIRRSEVGAVPTLSPAYQYAMTFATQQVQDVSGVDTTKRLCQAPPVGAIRIMALES